MNQIIRMHMTGIYKDQHLETDAAVTDLDLTDLSGTHGYCSDEAAEAIRAAIAPYPADAIHLLDSGNYHYLSKFWLEKICEPFYLVVFDHHTDMQPALGGLLSCGSWILDTAKENKYLEQIVLIGADESLLPGIDPVCRERMLYLTGTPKNAKEEALLLLKELNPGTPVYLSIDKDVLSPEELKTDWDQGTMSLKALCDWLRHFKTYYTIAGCDICGEPAVHLPDVSDRKKTEQINQRLINTVNL